MKADKQMRNYQNLTGKTSRKQEKHRGNRKNIFRVNKIKMNQN